MDSQRLARLIERHEIHNASCRSRKQGLVCSTCCDFRTAAERAASQLAAVSEAA